MSDPVTRYIIIEVPTENRTDQTWRVIGGVQSSLDEAKHAAYLEDCDEPAPDKHDYRHIKVFQLVEPKAYAALEQEHARLRGEVERWKDIATQNLHNCQATREMLASVVKAIDKMPVHSMSDELLDVMYQAHGHGKHFK